MTQIEQSEQQEYDLDPATLKKSMLYQEIEDLVLTEYARHLEEDLGIKVQTISEWQESQKSKDGEA